MEFGKSGSNTFHAELDVEKYAAHLGEFLSTLTEERRETYPLKTAGEIADAFGAFRGGNGDCVTDYFFFEHGEAPHRAMTKVGGAPYWPAGRPWPKDWRGRPLSFMCQINFIDSRDITPDLPGDILVVFTQPNSMNMRRKFCYWMNLGEDDLIDVGTVPRHEWNFSESYGVIHRAGDCDFGGENEEPGTEWIREKVGMKIGGMEWRGEGKRAVPLPLLAQVNGSSLTEMEETGDEEKEVCEGEDECCTFHMRYTHVLYSLFMTRKGKLQWRDDGCFYKNES